MRRRGGAPGRISSLVQALGGEFHYLRRGAGSADASMCFGIFWDAQEPPRGRSISDHRSRDDAGRNQSPTRLYIRSALSRTTAAVSPCTASMTTSTAFLGHLLGLCRDRPAEARRSAPWRIAIAGCVHCFIENGRAIGHAYQTAIVL